MNARNLARSLLVALALFVLVPLRGVHAAGESSDSPRGATVLSVEPLKPFPIGEQPSITVHLTTVGGEPLAKRLIRVFNYRDRATQGLTDSTGTARIPITFYFRPGTYPLLVAFDGSATDRLNASSSAIVLTIVQGTLQVQTVPPLPGVQFSFNGQTETTDEKGLVAFSVDHVGGYQIQALPLAQDANSNVRIVFDRWDDDEGSPNREFKFPAHTVLQAAFQISYRVNLKYTDQTNQVVDPARISLTRIRGVRTSYSLTDPGPLWLPGNYIRHPDGGALQNFPAIYYLDAVTLAGANVVDPGKQVYRAGPDSTWTIPLLLYSARFTAHDAILRSPIGSGILLQYPDGTQREFAFDQSNGVLQLDSLPRGSYHASVAGAQGLQPGVGLSFSQNQQQSQEFDLIVISRLDMGIILGAPALFIIFLLVIAGRSPFVWLMPRRRPA